MTHQQEDSLVHKLIDKHADLVVFFAIDNGAKKDLVIGRGKDLADIKAGKMIREISKIVAGSGGGKDDVAFGGTKDLSKFTEAKNALCNLVK